MQKLLLPIAILALTAMSTNALAYHHRHHHYRHHHFAPPPHDDRGPGDDHPR